MGDEPQRYLIKQGSQKSADFWEEEESRSPNAAERQSMRQAHSDEAKTVLDLLHSLVATFALADAFYVHYSRMLFGYSCEKHPFF